MSEISHDILNGKREAVGLPLLSPTAADQPTTEPSKDDLLDTQAGLALAHQAWHEGYAAHRRATQEQESTGKWHTPSNPYFSALVHAPAPQSAADTGRDERLRKAREYAAYLWVNSDADDQTPHEQYIVTLDSEVARLEEALRNYES